MTDQATAGGIRLDQEAANVFAEFIAETSYDDLPEVALQTARKSILDTLGVMVGATGVSPEGLAFIDLVIESGGRPESRVLGRDTRVPAWMAAFANGSLAHALDYDDGHPKAGHPSTMAVPCGFAVAERLAAIDGRPVDGRRFLAAMALSMDMYVRMGMALGGQPKHLTWHLTPTIGAFSATAMVGKLLGLDRDQLIDAFGIALGQSGFSFEVNLGVGSNLRGQYPAFPNKTGVVSALLAERGVTGPKLSLEGQAGLYPLHFGGDYDRDLLFDRLGTYFPAKNVVYKVWPSCGGTLPYIDAALRLRREHGIDPLRIQEVVVGTDDFHGALFEPLPIRQRPEKSLDAKFSTPYTLAVAFARGDVRLGDYEPDALTDGQLLTLAGRIRNVPQVGSGKRGVGFELIVTMDDGTEYRTETGNEYVFTDDQHVLDKFRDCISVAARPIGDARATEITDTVMALEEHDDVGLVMELLT